MRHRLSALVLTLALALGPATVTAAQAADPVRDALVGMLEKSRSEEKGVTLFVPGHSIAIVVTALHGTDAVEGRNQEYGRVLVRLDEVLAAALQ